MSPPIQRSGGAIFRHGLRLQARPRESRSHDVRGGWRNPSRPISCCHGRARICSDGSNSPSNCLVDVWFARSSPDNFPSYVSGLVMDPAMFDSICQGFGNNIRNYYQHMRGNDIFASHTVTNPQGWRPLGPADNQRQTPPTLRVINEDDSGDTINGLKMLGTA